MTAALILAILLYEPGAPALPQRMHRAHVLGLACEARGLAPAECVAVAYVESRLRPHLVSRKGCVGAMQVCSSPRSKAELLDLRTNAAEGARILAEYRDLYGSKRWRYYACSTRGARLGRVGCLRYEAAVRRTLARVPRWLLGGEA